MEQALRNSQERFEMAAEAANEGMWDWPDMSQDAQWWSPRMYELLGYADREVEASFSNFKAFLHPDGRDGLAEAVTRHYEQRIPLEMGCRLRTKSGDYCWFRDVVDQVRIKTGKPSACQVPFETLASKSRLRTNGVAWTHDFWRLRSWRVLACSPEGLPTTSTTY